ncbi:MAG: CDP-alcohol phosphatidyltransferase family protein [Thioalkalivibrionaceae bacterium]
MATPRKPKPTVDAQPVESRLGAAVAMGHNTATADSIEPCASMAPGPSSSSTDRNFESRCASAATASINDGHPLPLTDRSGGPPPTLASTLESTAHASRPTDGFVGRPFSRGLTTWWRDFLFATGSLLVILAVGAALVGANVLGTALLMLVGLAVWLPIAGLLAARHATSFNVCAETACEREHADTPGAANRVTLTRLIMGLAFAALTLGTGALLWLQYGLTTPIADFFSPPSSTSTFVANTAIVGVIAPLDQTHSSSLMHHHLGHAASPWAWTLLWTLAALALLLDAVDGAIARATNSASAFGARFDMEVDAAFLLVLSLVAWWHAGIGVWVLLIGAARYVFVAASWRWRWLSAPLPFSQRRRIIAALQGLALVIAITPLSAQYWNQTLVAVALAALILSFAIDAVAQFRRATSATNRPETPPAESTLAKMAPTETEDKTTPPDATSSQNPVI